MHKENASHIGNQNTYGNQGEAQATLPNHGSLNNRDWYHLNDKDTAVPLTVKRRLKAEVHVKMLVNHLIRWSQDHQASITTAIRGLCEGTLPKRTNSSLKAVLAAYQPETFLVASDLLRQVEENYGPAPDVLSSADAVLTRGGYVLNAVFTNGATSVFRAGGAA